MSTQVKEKNHTVLLGGHSVRAYFDSETSTWYFSVVDIIETTGKSSDPRNYWKVLKNRLNKTHSELVTACNQLKLMGKDGKYYLTDVTNRENILKIVRLMDEDLEARVSAYFEEFEENEMEEFDEDPEVKLLVDLYEEDAVLYLKAMLGGVDPKDIHIFTWPDKILIKGERKNHINVDGENYLIRELIWKKFSRVVHLPHKVETGKIKIALGTEGDLTIKMPKLLRNY